MLVDTTPDLRSQLLAAGVGLLDGVAWTHPHADHLHGIDDLRTVVQNRRARLPVWADAETADLLLSRFAYVFVQPAGSLYPPILDLRTIDGPFEIEGAGGAIRLRALPGRATAASMRSASASTTSPTCPTSPPSPRTPGPRSTASAPSWSTRSAASRTRPTPTSRSPSSGSPASRRGARILTNMHNDLDYATLVAELPEGIVPAHDGLVFEIADA